MSGLVFDPGALEAMCRRDLPYALRELAGHIERGDIGADVVELQGERHGRGLAAHHFLMTLHLVVKVGLRKRRDPTPFATLKVGTERG